MTTSPVATLRRATARLADFSGVWSSGEEYLEASPDRIDDLARLARHGYNNRIPFRTRGQGHSFNGSSLPHAGELLLRTDQLTHVRLTADGLVSAGGGAVVWDLEEWLRRRGRRLPMLHGGGQPAPSIGGWVAAGGVADLSEDNSGLWTAVEEIVIVRPTGEVDRITPGDQLFPWLFGSMGQLGIVAEVTLHTLPVDPSRTDSPIVGARLAPRRADAPIGVEAKLHWFNVLTEPSRVDLACELLDDLEERYRDTYAYAERYTYEVTEGAFRVPLLWPDVGSFWLVGVWGQAKQHAQAVRRFEDDFNALVTEHRFRRYIQAEVGAGEDRYRSAFGAAFEALRRWKDQLDPVHLLNRGSVFTLPEG